MIHGARDGRDPCAESGVPFAARATCLGEDGSRLVMREGVVRDGSPAVTFAVSQAPRAVATAPRNDAMGPKHPPRIGSLRFYMTSTNSRAAVSFKRRDACNPRSEIGARPLRSGLEEARTA